MATIKSYTDIEQSKKLAEILPLESADMLFQLGENKYADSIRVPLTKKHWEQMMPDINPCWSLAALLDVARTYCSRLETILRADKKYNVFAVKNDFVFRSFDDHPDGFDNLVDACYEMIIRLDEFNLL